MAGPNEPPKGKTISRRTMAVIAFVALAIVSAFYSSLGQDIYDRLKPAYRISVERNPDRISTMEGGRAGDGTGYLVVDKTIGEIEPPPLRQNECGDRYQWAKDRYQAIDATSTIFRITLEALKDEQVQLYDMEVRRLAVRPSPTKGVHLACPGRGGSVETKTVSIALDEDAPEVTVTDASDKTIPLFFSVKKGELDVFDVTALAFECDCSWELILLLRNGDKTFRERIGPFQTASSLQVPTFHWVNGDWFDIDTAAQQPVAPPPTPTGLDACSLLTSEEAAAFLGSTARAPSGGTTYTNGAGNVMVHHSTCTFVSVRPPPPDADPPGLTDSVTIVEEVAMSPDDAARVYEALLAGFGQRSSGAAVSGIADAATEFDGVLVARRGNVILQVQVGVNDKALSAGADGLARIVAQRVWP